MVTETGGEFKELHDALVNTESIEQFLHDMAVLAARMVGTDLSCGMTMRSNGRPVTVACSDPVAAKVDEVQYELDNGPCLHAMRDGHVVRIEDTADKARWPSAPRVSPKMPRGPVNHADRSATRSRSDKYPAGDRRR